MRTVALTLACLAYASHGKRLQGRDGLPLDLWLQDLAREQGLSKMKWSSSLERARAVDVLQALSALFLEFAYPTAKLAGHSRCLASNRLVASHAGETQTNFAARSYRGTYRGQRAASGAEIQMCAGANVDTLPCMAGLRKYKKLQPGQFYQETLQYIVNYLDKKEDEDEEERAEQSIGLERWTGIGKVRQRFFRAVQDDFGREPKTVQLREYWAGSEEEEVEQCDETVRREVTVLRALKAATRDNVKGMPFQELLGDATQVPYIEKLMRAADASESKQAFDREWDEATKGAPCPRANSIWLAFEWEGTWTLERFSDPEAKRVRIANQVGVRGMSKFYEQKWARTANFVVKGIIRQTLQALALLHETGFAHRALSTQSIVLSEHCPDGFRDSAVSNCNANILRVKLVGLSDATPLDDNSETRVKAAELWGTGDSNTLDLAALSIAEDLYAAGLCFLRVLFGALAQPRMPDSSGPAGSAQDFERLLEEFNGDVRGKFRNYIGLENDWKRVCILLDQPAGKEENGWDFLETILKAREAARERKETGTFEVLTAQKLLNHPFFMVDVWRLSDKRII